MELRPTTPADLAAMYGVFRAAIGELYRRHRFTPPDPPAEVFAGQQAHLLAHDSERCWVAEDDGKVVAFTAAFVRGDTWFLSSLFVHPGFQAHGLGGRLLDRAWSDGVARRLTVTDAIQPVSNGLYARRGLIPATPVLSFSGEPRLGEETDLEAAPADPEALSRLDRAAYGFDRAADHAMWRGSGDATLWLRAGEPVGYSYVWPAGTIGPVAGADPEAAGAAARAELARREGVPALIRVPGSAAPIVAAALTAGLRIGGSPGLLLVSQPHRPPDALAIGSYTLL